MALISFKTEEEIHDKLVQIAADSGTTLEAMMQRAAQAIVQQHEALASSADQNPASDVELDYPDWLKPALFSSGQKHSGRDIKAIIEAEWKPDNRD